MADKAISLEQFKEALKAIRYSTISEPDLSVRFVENAPNWNALEGEAGYILNRPFGLQKKIVIPDNDYTFEMFEEVGMMSAIFVPKYDFTNGEEYIVSYNGVEYSYVYDGKAFGNLGAFGEGEDTGEPFVIITSNPGIIIPLDGSESAKVSMIAIVDESIPNKYAMDLPSLNLAALNAPDVIFGNGYRIDFNFQDYQDFRRAAYKAGCFVLVFNCDRKPNSLTANNGFYISDNGGTTTMRMIFHLNVCDESKLYAYAFESNYAYFIEIKSATLTIVTKELSFA